MLPLLCCSALRLAAAGSLAPTAVVVHKANPLEDLSMAQLRKLFRGETRQWPNHRRVTLVQRDALSPAFQVLLDRVLRLTPAEYQRFRLNLEFRGAEPLAIKVLNSAGALCKFVSAAPGAIGLLEAEAISDPACASGVRVISLDHRMPGEADYGLK